MNVSFYYDKNEYTLPVKIHDNCYIYTKGSKVDVKFNIDDIPGTIEIKTNNFKWNLNLILGIILLGLILSYYYKPPN